MIRATVPELPKGMDRGTKGCERCGTKGRLYFVLARFSDGTGKLIRRWLCAGCKSAA